MVFFADALLSPFDGKLVIAGVGLHPLAVHLSPLAEYGLIDYRNAHHLVEKIDYLLGSGQAAEVPVDDDAVETVLYKDQQAAKQLGKRLHWPSSFDQVLTT